MLSPVVSHAFQQGRKKKSVGSLKWCELKQSEKYIGWCGCPYGESVKDEGNESIW